MPASPAGNSLESCRYPFQDSRTTAQSSLESPVPLMSSSGIAENSRIPAVRRVHEYETNIVPPGTEV